MAYTTAPASGDIKQGMRGPRVADLQQRLKAAGFDPGPIDGLFGSQTAAALKAFQKSKNLPQTGVSNYNTWKALTGGSKSSSSSSSSGGSSSKEDEVIDRMLKSEFGPIIKPFVDVEELRPLIVKLAPRAWGGEGWTEEKFLAAVKGTKWWNKRSEDQLNWETLTQGEKEARVQEVAATMFDFLRQNAGQDWVVKNGYTKMLKGINAAAGGNKLQNWAFYVASGRMSYEEWQVTLTQRLIKDTTTEIAVNDMARREELARQAKRPQEIAEEIWQQAHGDYFLNISKATAKKWADNIINGKSSFGELKDHLRAEAMKLYKGYSQAINNGVLPRQLFGPALGVLSGELEMSEEQIIADPKLWGEITSQAAGTKGHFTASDWVRYARAHPTWKKTRGAREMAAGFGDRLLRNFGAIA